MTKIMWKVYPLEDRTQMRSTKDKSAIGEQIQYLVDLGFRQFEVKESLY